ncbi:MAG: hypothetical protein HOK52_02600 [Candidatus Marinimicrobia bacterium]|jgi:hypothetical protein|nr:hypothetical protein [Candidatus Neomarinimicrobiota bacterium]MBT3936532.1 hypothetical protein [Candidatus Neomarinimicrobiota bacterium]MBT3961379.1 hypothetical protein [Candidatus Neomarinimicrobiota bacterium]MBT4382743.1 hypothetical protein [Candidatus Neomarinimicrobiota bacterium]MBT4636628.1 hypothetical protein [Candidatus Neomarinimicrobiota bacterium]
MKYLIHIFILSSLLYSQKIFDSFEQERISRYRYMEQYTFEQVLDDGSYTLIVNNFNGDMVIRGHLGSSLSANIKTTIKVLTEQGAKEMINLHQVIVRHDNDKKVVQIDGPEDLSGRISYNLDLQIPIMTNLTMHSLGGDVAIEHAQGEIEIKTGGGDMDLNHINGKGFFETAGGDIEFENGKGRFSIISKGGDISIENIEGKFSAETAGGDVELSSIIGNAVVSTRGGSIGVISFDGQYLLASTSGGDIHIRDINGNVDISTSGGDIEIQNLTGNAIASTLGGDVGLDEIHGNVDCSTKGGAIHGKDIFGAIKAVNQAGNISIEKKYDTQLKDHSLDLTTYVGDIYTSIPEHFPANVTIIHNGENATSSINADFYLNEKNKQGKIIATTKIREGIYPFKITIYHSGDIKIRED